MIMRIMALSTRILPARRCLISALLDSSTPKLWTIPQADRWVVMINGHSAPGFVARNADPS